MELMSLHLFDEETAQRYVETLLGAREPDAMWTWWRDDLRTSVRQVATSEIDAKAVSTGLVQAMTGPAFVLDGFSFTSWEARVDRGIGMLMRPPARALSDAGMDRDALLQMPIRLDSQGGMMGGTYVPARLMGKLNEMFHERLERSAKRMKDAEIDPYASLSLMKMAIDEAEQRGVGLIEAIDVITPEMDLITAPEKGSMNAELRTRIERAIEDEDKPGFFRRLFGR